MKASGFVAAIISSCNSMRGNICIIETSTSRSQASFGSGRTRSMTGNFYLFSYGAWTYFYDAEGRLTSASTENGQSA